MPINKTLSFAIKFSLGSLIIIHTYIHPSIGSNLQKAESAQIIVKTDDTTVYDSIQIAFWQDYIQSAYTRSMTKEQVFDNRGPGIFLTPSIFGSGYIGLVRYKGTQKEGFALFLINPGDSVQITVKKDGFRFSGKGALKMKAAYELEKLKEELDAKYYDKDAISVPDKRYSAGTFLKAAYSFFHQPLDSLLQVKIGNLECYRRALPPADFDQLKANLITEDYDERIVKFLKSRAFERSPDNIKRPLFEELYNAYLKHPYPPEIPDSLLAKCPRFVYSLLHKRKLDQEYSNGSAYKEDIISFAQKFTPHLRDKILTTYFLAIGINKVEEKLYREALNTIQMPEYTALLTSLRANTAVGELAFNFELEDPNGKVVRLQDFNGKVVFLDFWFTGCLWCKVYYEKLSEVEKHFRNNKKDIIFISVCVDKSKNSWLNSIKTDEYTSPHAVNLYTQGKGLSHELLSHYLIKAFPTQIVIDQKMKNYNINDGLQKLSVDEHIKYLEQLINRPGT